ncbi:sensor histidine kinase [Bacillus sp. WMMC1349]|uniref:sensor histidine kinase n=1 Tax=Bacillus sp. WMMC1349 TaxID=2736254 RepID=UPI001551956D|nr:sensor histidine kinase [Bacillus sp. WMMC1349]NPC94257.1 sensor histidine kinase [Bacillus sp. WMMC1349]
MFKAYLRDRAWIILFSILGTGFVTIVAALGIVEKGSGISRTNIFYMFILMIFFLSIGLIIDYGRQRSFLSQLNNQYVEVSMQTGEVLKAYQPTTKEQKMWTELVAKLNKEYREKLSCYSRERQQHLDFTNQWIHHMKTPVSVISLLIQEGKKQSEIRSIRSLLTEIEEENDRFRYGLDMMLHMARLDHFAIDLKAEQIDVISLLREIINEEKRQFIKRRLFPKLVISDDCLLIYSDKKWLSVVFQQILHNALKYSPQNKGEDIVMKVEQTGNQTAVSIIDHGVGIPAQDLPRIFLPFFTGENGRRQQEATGMGLYLSKEICRHLGHELRASSEQGKGTVMTVTFSSNTLHGNVTKL